MIFKTALGLSGRTYIYFNEKNVEELAKQVHRKGVSGKQNLNNFYRYFSSIGE